MLNNSPPVQARDQPAASPSFSPRETQVLELLRQGLTNREIALQLGISYLTVKVHLHHIYAKLGMTNRIAVILWLVKYNGNGNGRS